MKETYTRNEIIAIINEEIIKYRDDMFIPYADETSDADNYKRLIAKKTVDALRKLRNEFMTLADYED
jgi:hypothetical protein